MGFNLKNLNNLVQDSLKTCMKFGKYKGETINSIMEYDSEYIIHLYDSGILNPNSELLELIHETTKQIKIREKEIDESYFTGESHA